MKDIALSEVRNFAFAGHNGCGKTSLIEAMLYKMGVNDRLGSVAAGNGMADYTDEEKERKITLYAKPFCATYKGPGGKAHDFTFIDTPGYMDFYGQVLCASRVTDTGVLVVDAVAGVQVGTHRAWKAMVKEGLARAIVITGMDRENADYDKVLESISQFGAHCVPVNFLSPDGKSVVDIMGTSIPEDMKVRADRLRNDMMELAAETDDKLIEKFLGGQSLTEDELAGGLRKAVAAGGLVPVFVCLPLKDVGIKEFLDGICRMFPSPADVEIKDKDGVVIKTGAKDPFVGWVWRTVNDPFMGQLVFVRVIGGTLKVNMEIQNATKGQKEHIGSMSVVNGKKQTAVTEVSAGDMVAIPKLKFTVFSDTLCDPSIKVLMADLPFPSPVAMMAITAKTQADDDRIGTALARVVEDDHTLKVIRNAETKETILAGLGDVHIDVTVARMKNRNHVDVDLTTPKVAYHETITARSEGHYKHKKQSGGRGQFGEVYLRVAPKRHDDPEWFEDAIVGGAIPGNFVPAVQKGVAEAMTSGVLAGFHVTDVKTTVYDGSYHEVDSSEISFKIAGSRALKDAMAKAKPVLLEPVMSVKITIPDHYMGEINGDLNHKRGRILGMEQGEGMQVITADVPQSELFRYAAELRSMTAGQGTFEMEFSRYDIVPSNVAQKVMAASAKNKQVEEEE